MGELRRGSREFYSGRELEVDVFGKPKFPKAYEEAYRRLTSEKGGYLPFDRAQDLIREFTPEDPTSPSKEFARDLRLAVCEALELEGDEADIVKIYSALGTPLDVYHGVDAWIEIELEGLRAEVTLDVTKRAEKIKEGHKADVIIDEVSTPDQKKYLPEVEKYATEVVELLLSRLRIAKERTQRQVRR